MRFAQTWKMYDRVPMKHKSILLDEGFDTRRVNVAESDTHPLTFPVYCKPKPAPDVRWGHRIMVICDCGKHVPFGRMNQHYDMVKCTIASQQA